MPLHHLRVSPVDLTGTRLRLALNAPAPPPLVTTRLSHPHDGAVELGVLGASHLITVDHSLTGRFTEQVSCTADSDARDLPQRANAPGYQLHSNMIQYGEESFRRLAQRLREQCDQDPHWLGGAFPGDDAALTALNAAPDGPGWRWQTWHLYPGLRGGSAVYTTSRWRP